MKLRILLLFPIVLILSCYQENGFIKKTNPLDTDGIVVDDYIVISKSESLTPLLQKMASMPPTELDKWEVENNFVSLRSILNRAVKEETKYFDELESIGEQNLVKEEIKPHADYVLENAKYFRFHDEGWFELNIANQNLAPLLNKDGIIVIEGEARKYTLTSLYVSDIGDVATLQLITSDQTDLPAGVKKYAINQLRKELTSYSRYVTGSFSVNSCTGTAGNYRVRLYEDVISYYIGPTGTYALDHGFKVKSFRKTIFGDRNFDTWALAATVYYQASWGSDGKSITAAAATNEIGWPFITNYQYIDSNPPSIFNSQGQGWGRDGCTCTYSGIY